jgi:two-component system response regulator YesN
MARVLIVDDERVTRETLRDLVRWRELGVTEVETAQDGADALGRIAERAPDVIVCDIRMPRMDGLELANAVRGRCPDVGLIFLTGFAEKENLKAAIRLQAADFLEKPVNLREVSAAVKRLLAVRQARATESAEAQRARRELSELDPVRREAFALALLGRAGAEALQAHHGAPLCDAFLPGQVRAALAMLPPEPGDVLRPLRAQAVSRALNGLPGAVVAWPAEAARVGVLLGREQNRSGARLSEALEGIVAALAACGATPSWVGVGALVPRERLADSVRCAEEALCERFYRPEVRCFHADARRAPAVPFAPSAELRAAAAGAAARQDLDGVLAVFRRAEAEALAAGDRDLPRVRAAFVELLGAALEVAPGFDASDLHQERQAAAREAAATPGLRELSAGVAATLRRCLGPARGSAVDRRIERVKAYVRAEFGDPDLGVEAIAAAAGLSVSYLCTLFKSACGTTVKDHVTRVRVERAKELLRRDDDKLQAVALQVGFRDANYFSTVFKREVGVTPSEYRERGPR